MPRIVADVDEEKFHQFKLLKVKLRASSNEEFIFKLIEHYERCNCQTKDEEVNSLSKSIEAST